MGSEFRSEEEARQRADPRYSELPIVCQHCTHLISMGDQFNPEGWTCEAFPEGILYTILTNRVQHTDVISGQTGQMVIYSPKIYTEEHTGKKWHYTADAGWKYVGE